MKCMVVSNSATTRGIFRNALTLAGCDELVEVADGREAAELADGTVSAIVTDWGLPGMTGVELARHLRSRGDGTEVRIMVVTSRNARADVERAIAAGVDVYLLKPFTTDALRAKVEALVKPLLEADGAQENAEAA